MSVERDVKLLVANELLFSRDNLKAADQRSRRLWTMIRNFSYRYWPPAKVEYLEETFDGNTALLEICLENNDITEYKRLTVVMELFEQEVYCLVYFTVLGMALLIHLS